MRALLFVNLKKDHAAAAADAIGAGLLRRGVEVERFTFGEKVFSGEGPWDLAFSLGGDGTVLYAARCMAPRGVPVLPINLGTLGFLAAVRPEAWEGAFEDWRAGRARVSRRLMLEVRVERAGSAGDAAGVFEGLCLNEAVISAVGIAKLIRLQVSLGLDGAGGEPGRRFVPLGRYRSDGLLVATPTGSTAYSAAAGGPLLDPELDALILNPICPFTLSHRPLMLPGGETLLVEVEAVQRCGVLLTVDGQVTEPLEPGDRVSFRRASRPALLIASDRAVFYHALRTKLSWMGAPGVYSSQELVSGDPAEAFAQEEAV